MINSEMTAVERALILRTAIRAAHGNSQFTSRHGYNPGQVVLDDRITAEEHAKLHALAEQAMDTPHPVDRALIADDALKTIDRLQRLVDNSARLNDLATHISNLWWNDAFEKKAPEATSG
jgi:hypothetical protein